MGKIISIEEATKRLFARPTGQLEPDEDSDSALPLISPEQEPEDDDFLPVTKNKRSEEVDTSYNGEGRVRPLKFD